MKNLSEFKRKLQATFENNASVDFHYLNETRFKENHPFFTKYPDGVNIAGGGEQSCKIGRVSSTQFARIKHDGKESWMQYGSAANWSFPDADTAIWSELSDNYDHSHRTTITYKFNTPA